MHRPSVAAARTLVWTLALAPIVPTLAETPPAGTAELRVLAGPDAVRVELQAPAATLLGFEGKPRTPEQRATLALAAENLKTGDGLVRFNTQAYCRLEDARIDADPKAAKGRGADLGASYRFVCDQPQALTSAAVAIFMGFPAVERVRVRYSTAAGQGEALLTPRNPVVSFVPLGQPPAPAP